MREPFVTARGTLAVPTFLPDATRAGVRGVTSTDLRAIGVEGLVVNAFHLMRRPGARVLRAAGGGCRVFGWGGAHGSRPGGVPVWGLARSGKGQPRLVAVVQGGGEERLRRECAAALDEIGFDAYGFGGWPFAADGQLLT